MEYYVVYNGSPVFRGNQDDLDRYFNHLLRQLNCPVDYYTLDEFITVEYAYISEEVKGIEMKEYICANANISEEAYDELQAWLQTKEYKEFINHDVSTKAY